MKKKKIIRNAVIIGACLLAGGGVLSLLIAAARKEATHYCKGIAVSVSGSGGKAVIAKETILKQMQTVSNGAIINRSVKAIDVAALENALEGHTWIADAELYFDTHDILHVSVTERVPVARVFTTAGNTFYLDSGGQRMPLLPHVNVRVPVVTGFSNAKKLQEADSVVAREVTAIARYFGKHPFWNAQIAQIDITPAGTFELLPVVGNHIIRIGNAEGLETKLANLLLFYKQVLRHTGFDKYAVVDVRYNDQVIGSNEKGETKIDSVQLQRNILELIKRTRQQAEADSLAVIELNKTVVVDTALLKEPPQVSGEPNRDSLLKQQSKPLKKLQSGTAKKPQTRSETPKAVMKKRT